MKIPIGYKLIHFVGGSLDQTTRLVREPVKDGDIYEVMPLRQTWVYSEKQDKFVLKQEKSL